MSYSNVSGKPRRTRILRILSIVCFCVALALIFITYGLTLPSVQRNLNEINAWFVRIENFVAGYGWIKALVIIIFLFIFKSVIPIIPFSVIFVSCGMVFPAPLAVLINAGGIALLCSIKFFWGKRYGGGGAHKLARRSRAVTEFMGFKGKGNKWMLGLLCFIPMFPIGTVSRAYGATRMRYSTFIQLSLIGIMPRIILWSFVGVNIFDPFTVGFMAPFIVLLIISGISLLILEALLQGERIEKYEKESDQ